MPWRGVDPTSSGRHWALPGKILSQMGISDGSVQDKLEALDNAGRIYWPAKEGGTPRLKVYPDDANGAAIPDVWTDISPVSAQARERLGYPTQKPLALLERIIGASTLPGDTVLDPFCGCGTAAHAAQKLGRRWIGIDVTHYAVTLIENRVKAAFPDVDIEVEGRPQDMAAAHELARRNKYQFQFWACWFVGVQQYRQPKRGGDRGIDGVIFFRNLPHGTGRVIVSVKSGENLSPQMVRDLRGTVEREGAELGLLLTLTEPTQGMVTEAASAGFVRTAQGRFPRLQISTVEQLLNGARPSLPRPYERLPIERVKPRKAAGDPQLAFTFAIRTDGKKTGEDVEAEWVDPRELGRSFAEP